MLSVSMPFVISVLVEFVFGVLCFKLSVLFVWFLFGGGGGVTEQPINLYLFILTFY